MTKIKALFTSTPATLPITGKHYTETGAAKLTVAEGSARNGYTTAEVAEVYAGDGSGTVDLTKLFVPVRAGHLRFLENRNVFIPCMLLSKFTMVNEQMRWLRENFGYRTTAEEENLKNGKEDRSNTPEHFLRNGVKYTGEQRFWPLVNFDWFNAFRDTCSALNNTNLVYVHDFYEDENGVSQIHSVRRVVFTLPSASMHEYAARGGEAYEYAGSNNIKEVAWYIENSGNRPHRVGELKKNGYGASDMSGNVWEWTGEEHKDDETKAAPDADGVTRRFLFGITTDASGKEVPVFVTYDEYKVEVMKTSTEWRTDVLAGKYKWAADFNNANPGKIEELFNNPKIHHLVVDWDLGTIRYANEEEISMVETDTVEVQPLAL